MGTWSWHKLWCQQLPHIYSDRTITVSNNAICGPSPPKGIARREMSEGAEMGCVCRFQCASRTRCCIKPNICYLWHNLSFSATHFFLKAKKSLLQHVKDNNLITVYQLTDNFYISLLLSVLPGCLCNQHFVTFAQMLLSFWTFTTCIRIPFHAVPTSHHVYVR